MGEHPLDGEMGFAGIGWPENGRDAGATGAGIAIGRGGEGNGHRRSRMGDGMMLLLRDAIRHSATAAAKRSEDSRYKIEPRVQVFCHPFKQRLEPRVHLAGAKIPASTMSGKRPFPSHSSSSNLARAVRSDASMIRLTSSRLKLQAIDRRCTDNGGPHRRNRGNRPHRDRCERDRCGSAPRIEDESGWAPERASVTFHGRNRWSCLLAATSSGRALDRSSRALTTFGRNGGQCLEVSQSHRMSPCRAGLASGRGERL